MPVEVNNTQPCSDLAVDITLKADADYHLYRYCAMKFSSTVGNCTLATAMGQTVLGVMQNKPVAGEQAVIRVFGFSKACVDGSGTAITTGSSLVPSTGGVFVYDVAQGAGDQVIARAYEATSVVSIIKVFVQFETI